MEIDTLRPSNEAEQNQTSNRRRLPVSVMATMWMLGAINWSSTTSCNAVNGHPFTVAHNATGRSKWPRRIASLTSIIVLLILITTSILTYALYLICYFGKTDHFLRFMSFSCYWPTMILSQVVCLIACISLKQRSPAGNEQGNDITWVDVFNETSFTTKFNHFVHSGKRRCIPRIGVFVFLYLCALIVLSVRVLFLLRTVQKCPRWLLYLYIFGEISGLMLYATFCYYLCLWCTILEENCKETTIFIKRNVGKLDPCVCKVREFFRCYLQLRKLVLPWLSFMVFSSAFGITVFFTWNYDKELLQESNTTSTDSQEFIMYGNFDRSICPYKCDKVKFLKYGDDLLLYNIFVLSRHILTGLLPMVAVSRADVKFIWNRLRMNINYLYGNKDKDFWVSLIKFMDTMHPSPTLDLIFVIVLPLLPFAYGLLRGREKDF